MSDLFYPLSLCEYIPSDVDFTDKSKAMAYSVYSNYFLGWLYKYRGPSLKEAYFLSDDAGEAQLVVQSLRTDRRTSLKFLHYGETVEIMKIDEYNTLELEWLFYWHPYHLKESVLWCVGEVE
jgi:hypothetical protein